MKSTKFTLPASFLAALFFLSQVALAQEIKTSAKSKTDDIKTKSEVKTEVKPGSLTSSEPENRVETLSGISLFPNRKTGDFNLRFSQVLKDTANLELKNEAGKVLYALNLLPTQMPMAKAVSVGNLNSGIYLIEVKTDNTTYWKKVRIRK